MDSDTVRKFYDSRNVVDHYARATANVGLWESEEKIFTQLFNKDQTLLDVGTGAGRIALALAELGYEKIMGVDLSRQMIKRARKMNELLGYGVSFQVEDATRLSFDDNSFDGAIFGFNGLMQIPRRENRIKALKEIRRVLANGATFVFTTHDRHASKHRRYWNDERRRWDEGRQKPELDEFGDRFEVTDLGELYIHIPTTDEVRGMVKEAGFKILMDVPRSNVANEPLHVREFADECRFWIVRAEG